MHCPALTQESHEVGEQSNNRIRTIPQISSHKSLLPCHWTLTLRDEAPKGVRATKSMAAGSDGQVMVGSSMGIYSALKHVVGDFEWGSGDGCHCCRK